MSPGNLVAKMSKKSDSSNGTVQRQSAAESRAVEVTMFDEQEFDFYVLEKALVKAVKITEMPWAGKESFVPIKIKKENVELLVNKRY